MIVVRSFSDLWLKGVLNPLLYILKLQLNDAKFVAINRQSQAELLIDQATLNSGASFYLTLSLISG